MPGTNFPQRLLPPGDGSVLFAEVAEQLRGADLLLGNFESTLTDYPKTYKNTKRSLVFAFRTPPAFSRVLREAGFDVLSVANNHSYDFTLQGYRDTVKNIRQAGILAVGERGQLTVFRRGKVVIPVLGFSYMSLHNSIRDNEGLALIAQAAKLGPVIVTIHGGAEGGKALHTPNRDEIFYGENRGNLVSFAHRAIDAGADLIIGHGPHVPRALELYRGRLIAYSLGNFVGYRMFSIRGAKGLSLVLEVDMSGSGAFCGGRIVPLRLAAPGIPRPDPKAATVALMRRLTRADFPKTGPRITKAGRVLAPVSASDCK